VQRSGAEPVYGIGAVTRMLGLTPAVLRAWEERYGVVIPSRSPGDQRLYSRDQVDQLRYVHNLIDSGLQAAEAHRLLAHRIEDGMTLVPAPSARTAQTVSVLLAERDIYAAELVEYLLRTEGYEVVVALDSADAVAAYDRRRADLVVVELVISGGSGLELCRTFSAAGARVVAVSALDLRAAAVDAGAEAFLRKPLDPLQVLSIVKDLVGTSHMTRRRDPATQW
jgi:DNA-binding transcriptional MerR regulator